jgi:hypothetical protein
MNIVVVRRAPMSIQIEHVFVLVGHEDWIRTVVVQKSSKSQDNGRSRSSY